MSILRSVSTCCFLAASLLCGLSSSQPLWAQLQNPLGDIPAIPGLDLDGESEPELTAKFIPAKVSPGDEVTLQISIGIATDEYVYSLNPNVGAETQFNFESLKGLKPQDSKFHPDRDPKTVIEPLFGNAKLEKFYGGVTWSRKYIVQGDTPPSVEGTVTFQICTEDNCIPYRDKPISATAELAKKQNAAASLMNLLEEEPAAGNGHSESSETADVKTLPLQSGAVIASQKIRPHREIGDKDDPVEFEIKLLNTTATSKGEQTAVLAITAKVDEPWHLYALTQDPEMFGLPTVLEIAGISGLKPLDEGFIPTEPPEIVRPFEDTVQQLHHGEITWQKRYQVTGNEIGSPIEGTIQYQLCESDGSCLPPKTISFQLGSQTGNSSDSTKIASNTSESKPSEKTVSGPIEEAVSLNQQGLIPFLITGAAFGFIALLTPCVFPMIPITVSFFLKQAEKEHHRPIGMATVYCLSIIATFTIIGIGVSAIFGASAMTQLANGIWFNIALAGVLIFFGLNMLGLFEIRVPSWLLTWSSGKESRGGFIGVIFMALTFTLVSFTCTFAFVGSLLPMAAQGDYTWPILGMIAFSTAFSSPFFFLALFPSYLKKLPKSGGWMNNVKVTFGFLEIGAALKFLSVADINWFSAPFLFDYTLVMTSWMVLAIVTGLYLLGLFRTPHDSPTESIGVIRLCFALLFLGFSGYLAAGVYGTKTPDGAVWQQIAAFAPPSYESKSDIELGPALEHDELLYALDVEQAVQFAAANNQPLFFDFTGTNCVNCRFMEINVFPKSENRKLLEEFVRVQLYTDSIPQMSDASASDALLNKNRKLQAEWFNDATLPAYAIVTPDGETILESLKGKTSTSAQFTRFLEAGLEEWQRLKTASATASTTRR